LLSPVTTKGQVTIPADIRTRFHIQPNDLVDFMVDGERIVLTPVRTLRELRGVVTATGVGNAAAERAAAKSAVAGRVKGEMA